MLMALQELCLGRKGQDCRDVYIVQQEDYCAKIAQEEEVDLNILLSNNRNVYTNCTNLMVGEVSVFHPAVCIPQSLTSFIVTGSVYCQRRDSV